MQDIYIYIYIINIRISKRIEGLRLCVELCLRYDVDAPSCALAHISRRIADSPDSIGTFPEIRGSYFGVLIVRDPYYFGY